MKIKQRKHIVTSSHKKLCIVSAYISDHETKSVYFKLRPLPPLSYATADLTTVHIFFYF